STAFSVFTVRAAPRSPPLSLHDALPIYRPNAAETVEHYAKSPLIGRYSYLCCCIGYCCIVAALRCRVTDGRLFVAPIIAYLSLTALPIEQLCAIVQIEQQRRAPMRMVDLSGRLCRLAVRFAVLC